jgi:hypothetical protein
MRFYIFVSLVGCANLEPIGSSEEAVEYAWAEIAPGDDFYYAVNSKPSWPNEIAAGTVFVPMRDASGAFREVTSNGVDVPLRQPCGVTFISNNFAITAAHCVPESQVPDPAAQVLVVQAYAPGMQFSWPAAMTVTDDYPDYDHAWNFVGNNVTNYECKVVVRCGKEFDLDQYQCGSGHENADIALLQCTGEPGCDFAQIDAAKVETAGAPVQMAWAHEVFNVDSSDLYDHYSVFDPDSREPSYHLFGGAHNLLIPLRSTLWPRPTPGVTESGFCWERAGVGSRRIRLHSELFAATPGHVRDVRWTELLGCNDGGAGVVTSAQDGTRQLLGPVSTGVLSDDGSNRLSCHVPEDFSCVPGANRGLAYTQLPHTQFIASKPTDLSQVCSNDAIATPNLWLTTGAHQIAEVAAGTIVPETWPAAWPSASSAWDASRIYNEPMVRIRAGGLIRVPGSTIVRGERYRVSLRVRSLAGSAPLVKVRLGTQVVLASAAPLLAPGESAGLVAQTFAASAGGTLTLEISTAPGSGDFGVTEIVLVPDETPNGFDSHRERSGVGVRRAGAPLEPMRYVGGASSRFAALLQGGDRLLMTRHALLPGHGPWSIDFTASSATIGLTCGFVFADGTELAVPCDAVAGVGSATLATTATARPIAFFLDLPLGHAEVAIDDLAIRSTP